LHQLFQFQGKTITWINSATTSGNLSGDQSVMQRRYFLEVLLAEE